MVPEGALPILARVDELIQEGRLETSDGPYPVLRVAA